MIEANVQVLQKALLAVAMGANDAARYLREYGVAAGVVTLTADQKTAALAALQTKLVAVKSAVTQAEDIYTADEPVEIPED